MKANKLNKLKSLKDLKLKELKRKHLLKNLGLRIAEIDESLMPLIEKSMGDFHDDLVQKECEEIMRDFHTNVKIQQEHN